MREIRKGQSNKLSSGIFNLRASVGVKCRTNVLRGWLAFPLPDLSLSIRLAEGPTYPGSENLFPMVKIEMAKR